MNDSKRTLICPACGKEMEKVYIEDAGFYLDICSKGCGGIYFDARELTAFDEGDEDIKPVENALAEGDYAPVNEDKLRVCPSCGTNMVKHSTSVKNKVVIDECYLCGGKFFDYNELQALRAEYETEEDRSADAHETFAQLFGIEKEEWDAIQSERHKKRPVTKVIFDGCVKMPLQKFFDNVLMKGECS